MQLNGEASYRLRDGSARWGQRGMSDRVLIVDALSAGSGRRVTSRDAIGCGPRTIAGVLEMLDVECRIARAEDVLDGRVRLRNFAHIAVSAMTTDQTAVSRVIRRWRRRRRGNVLLGGPIASGGERVLSRLRPDAMVIGEGERTVEDLIKGGFLEGGCDLHTIKGIGFLHQGQPVLTEQRDLMDENTMRRYVPSVTRIVDYPAYQASKVYVEVLRGCSNFLRTTLRLPDGRQCDDCGRCTSPDPVLRVRCPHDIPPGCGFCSVPATWGAPRSRNIESIVTEVEELLTLGVHRIVLEAPDFLDFRRGRYPATDPCAPAPNLRAIESLLSSIASLPAFREGRAHLSIENIKACLFTPEVAQIIARYVKDTSPNIGLESGSREHRRRVGKCGDPADVVRAVRTAREVGMRPFVYLIYGLPGEDDATVRETINLLEEIDRAGAERIILYAFEPLPGSAFADFPRASPRDRRGRLLREAVERINRRRKRRYVGRIVRGIAAEASLTHRGYTMVYPLGEGPIMTVAGGYTPGTLLDVRITRVLSAGLLLGTVLREGMEARRRGRDDEMWFG